MSRSSAPSRQHKYGERRTVVDRGVSQRHRGLFRQDDQYLDLSTCVAGIRIVVRPVTFFLKLHERPSEVGNRRREAQVLGLLAGILRKAVLERAIGLTPRATAPPVASADESVSTFTGERMERGVVRGAHRAPQIRLARPLRIGPSKPARGYNQIPVQDPVATF